MSGVKARKLKSLPGLPHGVVVLAEHTSRWSALYVAEAARIAAALGPVVIAMEHYGSTSIPGIKAKPIIDILVGVERLEDATGCIPAMQELGYIFDPNAGVPGHHIFGKGAARTHIVHFVEHGGEGWRQGLAFRDRLISDPDAAKAYQHLKVELAARYPNDRAAYTAGKSSFVEKLRGD